MSGRRSALDRHLRLAVACATVLIPCVVLAQTPTTQPATPEPATPQPAVDPPAPQPSPESKRTAYAPGITIDRSVPQVEVDARIVLREGRVKLLACLENTKDSASILTTAAQPSKLREALSMIGLVPGHPMSHEPATDSYTPASGPRLALELHYPQGTAEKVVAAHEWLLSSKSNKPIAAPAWIFCGSRTTDGALAADKEGTIATVVDFDSALIGLADRHSAADSDLWVAANTDAIPSPGTSCKLVISALDVAPLVLTLTPEGYFLWGDDVLDPLALDAIIRWRTRHFPAQAVELMPMEVAPEEARRMNLFVRVAARAIVGSGIAQDNMTFDLLEEPPQEETVPAPAVTTQPAAPAPAPIPTTQASVKGAPPAAKTPTTQPAVSNPPPASPPGP